MSRVPASRRARAVTVWLLATLAVPATAAPAGGALRVLVRPSGASFADLLVALSAVTLVLATARLWIVTTLTVVDLLRGRVQPRWGGATRRLVLVACGAAVAAGTMAPASATDGDAGHLDGLRIPERATSGPGPQRPGPPARPDAPGVSAAVHVVVPGESLWSIAQATGSTASDVHAAWRAIWAANRDVVGDDPDLILPGQRLRLPSTDALRSHQPSDQQPSDQQPSNHQPTEETGDRP